MDEKKFDADAFVAQGKPEANRTLIGYENFANDMDQETFLDNYKNARFESILLAAGIYARYGAPVTLPFDMPHELPETRSRADDYMNYAHAVLQPYCEFVRDEFTKIAEVIAEGKEEKYSTDFHVFERFLHQHTAPLAIANRLLCTPVHAEHAPYLHTNIMNGIEEDWTAYVDALNDDLEDF